MDGDGMEFVEQVMLHFKCCETKAKSIIEKYIKNDMIDDLKKLVREG
jgi:hypothetical protein